MPFDLAIMSPYSGLPRQQPQVNYFIRDLRLLWGYIQESFATVLGGSFSTLSRGENVRMQPSPLALKQVKTVLKQLSNATNATPQVGSKVLLEKYASN